MQDRERGVLGEGQGGATEPEEGKKEEEEREDEGDERIIEEVEGVRGVMRERLGLLDSRWGGW